MKRKPVIVSYGSCQAINVACLLGEIPSVTDRFEVVPMAGFPASGQREEASPETVEACEFLFYQQAEGEILPLSVQEMIRRGKGLRYPNLFCQVVWPQHVERLPEDARSEEFPFGHFPYGDAHILDLLEAGLRDEQILSAYLQADLAELYSLDSLADRWFEQGRETDKGAAATVAEFIWDRWRVERLFWAVNHPSNRLFGHILQQLLTRSLGSLVSSEELEAALKKQELDHWVTPVHPSVARLFQLQWVSRHAKHNHRGFGELTLEAWTLAYIRRMRAVRAQPPVLALAR